jgi:cob(I)alamin adenosyltransferase
MKFFALGMIALFWLIAAAPDANAVVCARGVYRSAARARVVLSSSDTLTIIAITAA